ncbi:hypothetical protein MSj_00987 [Microcystis aeruginosa Sj]|uniref:Uncharacterized protein n=1 Tax=Microcystis aeruginosa Sj TaxID=1979544 RepID=A0A2Z6UUL4_MICAE|nr:hypothetical protein [Microcystis aeruginosa]GBL09508.1 hypothetical protein MSj_00987 [Microcystis aeruginosa Sj]
MKASNYQEIAKAAILAGGLAAAGVLSVGESAQAQFIGGTSQSRVSAAVTSILTDGNAAATNSFAVEQVLPSVDYVFTGAVTVTLSYATQNINGQTVVAITSGQLSAVNGSNAGQGSVERATAAAISAASGLSQFGDVSGIVRAWSAGTSVLD